MTKPTTRDGYSPRHALDCERVLVTLLRGLGPWKDAVYLVGGLTPRYLVNPDPPRVPEHSGTQDVDIVIDLQLLTDTAAYNTLEQNLKRIGFARAENDDGVKVSWRWQIRTENGTLVLVELLTDAPDMASGRHQPLPTDGALSAINIPHASIVHHMHSCADITAELLGDDGTVTERIRHADRVAFTCLKAFAFDDRNERKDAHDLVYCLEYAAGGLDEVVEDFRRALTGAHAMVVRKAIDILRNRFADDAAVDGYRKDGPVAVAKFELGDSAEPAQRDARALRQRQVSDLIERLLRKLA